MARLTTAALWLLLAGPATARRQTFESILTNGTIKAEFVSTSDTAFDGPKLGYPGPANDTSYDW